MSATYYSQLLHAYRWDIISDAIDEAIRTARFAFERDPASFPTDGIFIKHDGVTANAIVDMDNNPWLEFMGSVYLGQGFRDSPSGSFYAPWSAVPDRVRERDAAWWEAFNRAADKHNLYLMSGEGDPTDTYVYRFEPVS